MRNSPSTMSASATERRQHTVIIFNLQNVQAVTVPYSQEEAIRWAKNNVPEGWFWDVVLPLSIDEYMRQAMEQSVDPGVVPWKLGKSRLN